MKGSENLTFYIVAYSDPFPVGLKWKLPFKKRDFEQMAELAERTVGPWILEKIR